MLPKNQKTAIEKFVINKLDTLNWMHVKGVRPIARALAKKEKANLEIVDVAVLFHDITKPNYKDELNHHLTSAKTAKKFLNRIKADKKFIENKPLHKDAYGNLFTKTAKKMARERIKYVRGFFNTLEK